MKVPFPKNIETDVVRCEFSVTMTYKGFISCRLIISVFLFVSEAVFQGVCADEFSLFKWEFPVCETCI